MLLNKTFFGRKEGNVLFNDALNTFYLRLYGVGHMVEDHSDSERGNPLPPHGLLFQINSKVFLYASSQRHLNNNGGQCSCCQLESLITLRDDSVPERRKEGNVLFNNALNIFYLRFYGVGYIGKNHWEVKPAAAAAWVTLSD